MNVRMWLRRLFSATQGSGVLQSKRAVRRRLAAQHRPSVEVLEDRVTPSTFNLVEPNPQSDDQFGVNIVPLATGNIVVTASAYNNGAGAVYLFNGTNGNLISSLFGSTSANIADGIFGDQLGFNGVIALSSGNFLVPDSSWDGNRGAVTFGNGTTGVNGPVSSANSLVGSTAADDVGRDVLLLSNGNYVVDTNSWSDFTGAVTWGSGATGVTGAVSAANSLTGSTSGFTGDAVGGTDGDGGGGITTVSALPDGNYVVVSADWNGGTGAVTWGNGATGITGIVSAANSLVGSNPGDFVGGGVDLGSAVTPLSTGNYVVASPIWDGNSGAVTFASDAAGITGAISADNSLIGGQTVTPLTNGNYVVNDPRFNSDQGAVTFVNGTTGLSGTVGADNSLVGTDDGSFYDEPSFIIPLTNGNFVIDSSSVDIGTGAVTFASGTTGIIGTVSSANSLVGSIPNAGAITALPDGNYVVDYSGWQNGLGAVTFGNGTTGISGTISSSNSLVGSTAGDDVGSGGITVLSNGNYVVSSFAWNNDMGAATLGSGATGVSGGVSASNSLVGSTGGANGDQVGGSITALANGNYVVVTPTWDNGDGAATFGNGTAGTVGTVSSSNSIVGSFSTDAVGSGGVTALSNGNYVVSSDTWNGNLGAATFGSGTIGVSGVVSSSNSLVGSDPGDEVGASVVALTNGNYIVVSPSPGGGSITYASGATGITGTLTLSNSLNLDSSDGATVAALGNGSYYVSDPDFDGGTGAVTVASSAVTGNITANNSLIGPGFGSGMGVVVVNNGAFLIPFENDGIVTVYTPGSSSTSAVEFTTANETVNESAGTFSITINLSAAAGSSVSVPFTLGGSAANGTDFSDVTASPLVIPAGQTSGAITGTLLADPGANQTLTITLGTPTGADLGSPSVNTLTIDEPATTPTVQFSAGSETLNESAGTFSIPITLSAAAGTAVDVPFTLGGSATNGIDYSGVSASPLVIQAGQIGGTITGTLLSDPGANQTLTVTLGTPTGATLGSPSVNTLTIAEPSTALFSDDFNRPNATADNLGQTDDALGGAGAYFYVPIFPLNGTDASHPIGASIVGDVLQNNGLDFGGVQFTTSSNTSATRGTSVGDDLDMTVSLLVPTDAAGDISEAGVYFRSRAAFSGDGIIGGASTGYWVRLLSTGLIEVLNLSNNTVVAFTAQPVSFNTTVFHQLQIAAQGSGLQVALDGVLQTFDQAGSPVTTVAIPPTVGGDDGTAGIAFGAPRNRGQIGGEEADNLIVSSYTSLASLPTGGVLLVTNTSNTGAGSLRQAITNANSGLGAAIQFAITEAGTQTTITPASPLPAITSSVSIDGATEPFFTGMPLVEIVGSSAGAAADGFSISGDDATIQSLNIEDFGGAGILLTGTGNTIGGTTMAEGNIITANSGDGIDFSQGVNSALDNSIALNMAGEIVLGAGANRSLPAPTLSSAVAAAGALTLSGTFNAVDSGDSYRLEFFASTALDTAGKSQGRQFLGSETLNSVPAGSNSFSDVLMTVPVGGVFAVTVTDLNGAAAATSPFSAAVSHPLLLSVTPSVGLITSALVGSTFKLTLQYNQRMSATPPTIVFSASANSTLTFSSGSWNSAHRAYTAIYKVAASGVNVPIVGVTVTGAKDAGGNTQLAFSQTDVFGIDTVNPTVTSITPSVATIADAQLGHATFTLAIQYGTAMNTSVTPTVSLSSSANSTLTRALVSWNGAGTVFTVTYNVADVFVSVPTVMVTVSGAKNADGNLQKTATGTFAIDTVNPTVKSITSSLANITDAQVGTGTFTLTVTFSGPMNAAIAPTITFIPPVSSTLSLDGPGTWKNANTVYTQAYDVADSSVSIAGVAVAVSDGANSDGNLQHPFEKMNAITINTANPTVVAATPSPAVITNAQVGKNGFSLVVTYGTAMSTTVTPTIAFSPIVSTSLTPGTGSGWSAGNTVYTAVFNVANVTAAINGIQATISNGKSSVGNPQIVPFQSALFAINITASSAPNISVTETNTTASVNSNYFGETFVPTVAGALTQLNVLDITNLYSNQGQALASAGATIQIYAGGINTTNPALPTYDTPAGTLLYSQPFTFSVGNNDIVFTTPPTLKAGQTYLWRVVVPSVATIYVDFATNNPYLQGDTLAGPGFGYDLPFQIFI